MTVYTRRFRVPRQVPPVLLLAFLPLVPAVAAPPPNDELANATTIDSLPFADALDTTTATQDFDDFRIACFTGQTGASVWYKITAFVPMRIVADTFGSNYDTTLAVGCVSDALGNLSFDACNNDAGGTLQSQVRFLAPVGRTCFIKADSSGGGPGGNLSLHLDVDLPPPEMADLLFGQFNFILNTRCNDFGLNERSLCRPNGMAVDDAGNLYVADTGNHRVLIYRDPLTTDRVADMVIGQPGFLTGGPNTGGLSASSLASPAGVALDGLGNLYVADRFNNRVLVYLDPLATDAAADAVFGQPDFLTGTCSVAPGGPGPSAINLCGPQDVAVDFAGNLYVSEFGTNRVVVFLDPLATDAIADLVIGQPNFTTSTGNNGGRSAGSLSFPTGLVLDGAGNLYIGDTGNDRVLAYLSPLASDVVADVVLGQADFTSRSGGFVQFPDGTQGCETPTATSLCDVRRLAVDAGGRLFVADSGLSVFTVNIGTASSRALRYDDPLGSDAAADQVFGQQGFTSAGCNADGGGFASAFTLCQPQDVAVDSAGNVYIADTSNSRVLAFRTETTDFDGVADAFDACPNDPRNDSDLDGHCADADNCLTVTNANQANADGDALGDACDPCPNDPNNNDADGDGFCDEVDACPSEAPALGLDADHNGCTDTIAGLKAIVQSLSVGSKLKNGLLGKLEEAEKALGRGNIVVAVNKLRDFITQVEGQRGLSISESDADLLVAYANNLITLFQSA